MNVMGQGREPIAAAFNREGSGNYSIPNHTTRFEGRPEIFEYNHYISNYGAEDWQMEKFDNSVNTSIPYEDLFGNLQVNGGRVFGKMTNPPTPSLMSNSDPKL